jgi:hypothetical protein
MKLAFLAFLLVFLVVPLAHASVGMGISDYDSNVNVIGGRTVKVGQVTNTGNETLVFSYVWKQVNATVKMTLPVSCINDNFTLQPDGRFEPAILIGDYNESFVGNYTGVVEITASYPVQSGNMVLPGATFHVSVTATLPDQPQSAGNALAFIILTACIVAVVLSVALYFEWKQGKRKL